MHKFITQIEKEWNIGNKHYEEYEAYISRVIIKVEPSPLAKKIKKNIY